MTSYNPKDYWERRLRHGFNLSKVGNIGFGKYYNKWLYKAKIRALQEALLTYGDIYNKAVCDVGCGTGFFIEFYRSQGAREIVGVDITAISIENLKRKYPEYNFIKEDISSPLLVPKINRKFDILNVFDVLYHVTEDKLFEQAITNICSLTSDVIFITDLFGPRNINIADHVRFRSREIYKQALGKNGAKCLAVYPLYYFLNRPIIFGKFRAMLLRKIGIAMDDLFVPIYYYLDKIFLSLKRSNLSLLVAKKVKP